MLYDFVNCFGFCYSQRSLTQNNIQTMFDMLDDDDIDLGYVPTAPGAKSRASSMKKMTKKEPKAQPKPKNNNVSEFDDLLDDLLEKESKAVGIVDNKSSLKEVKPKKDSFDFDFDEPKPKSPEKNKLIIKEQVTQNTFGKNRTFKGDQSDEIISEDVGFNRSFNKPAVTTVNLNKVQTVEESPIFTSTRNMKPPLKKKESQGSISPPPNFGGNSPSLTIPEQVNLTLSSNNKNEDDIIRPPPRLMGRRPSVESKQQKNDDINFSTSNLRSESLTLAPEKKEVKKNDNALKSAGRGLFLSFQEPKVEKKEQNKTLSIEKETKPQPQKAEGKKISVFQRQSKSLDKPKEELRLGPSPSAGIDLKIDQSMTWKETPPPSSITAKPVLSGEDNQKQFEYAKKAFQKQIDFLQENLEKQIAANREIREKITQESNRMIDDERARSKKIFQEELRRQQDVFQWQKKRLKDHYESQITCLRQSLDAANRKIHISTYNSAKASREDVEYLELQLKNQKKLLEDRERIIQKREMDLQQREAELSKRRKVEEQRLKHEERRLIEMETNIKKQALDDKKLLAEQKQQIAIEMANIQLEVMRKKQKADYSLKENRIAREGLDKERAELRLANAQLMSKYRAKCQQLQDEKERITRIEHQLIQKIRVVEMKGKQVSSVNKTMYQRKENNWLDEKNQSKGQIRAMSVQKRNANQKSILDMNKTKERFCQLQSSARDKLNISVKENKRFDLDQYMLTVENYNKLKCHA